MRRVSTDGEYVSPNAFKRLSGLSTPYIRKRLAEGSLPYIRVGVDYRIAKQAALEQLAREAEKNGR